MNHRSPALGALAAACALALAAPVAAGARPVFSELRVEAEGQAASPGISYVTDTVRLRASTSPACGGSGAAVRLRGPTALGLLDDAQDADRDLRPVQVSDRFGFGLFVCGIDGWLVSGAQAFWVYKVNHVSPDVGADQRRLRNGDRVLWYFVNTASGVNTGDELELLAPARVRPGQSFQVTVFAWSRAGARTPAVGARVGGATTDANGHAVVTAGSARSLVLRAERGSDVPSAPTPVCVSSRLSRCPARRGLVMVGRDRSERIRGGSGGDAVFARGGNDTVFVRGGDRDVVSCGRGRDVVFASRNDRVRRDCERVVR